MSVRYEIRHENSAINGPWGLTWVQAEYGSYDFSRLTLQGHADVTTNEFSILLVQQGAAYVTATRMFNKKPAPFHPVPPQTGLLGVRVLERESKKTSVFRAEPCETLTVAIEPSAIVVEADNGGSIRELYRAPLAGIAAVQTEAELPSKPRQLCSLCAGRDPANVRLLIPVAIAS
jgi:hypothetical protein